MRGRQKTQSSGSENSLFSLVRSRTSYLSSFLLSSLYNEAEVAAGPVLAFFVIFLFLWKTKTGQKRPHVMSLESRAAKLLSPVSCVSSSFFSSLSLSLSQSFFPSLAFYYIVSCLFYVISLVYLSPPIFRFLSLFFFFFHVALSNVFCLCFACLSPPFSLSFFLCLCVSYVPQSPGLFP